MKNKINWKTVLTLSVIIFSILSYGFLLTWSFMKGYHAAAIALVAILVFLIIILFSIEQTEQKD